MQRLVLSPGTVAAIHLLPGDHQAPRLWHPGLRGAGEARQPGTLTYDSFGLSEQQLEAMCVEIAVLGLVTYPAAPPSKRRTA